MTRTAAREIAVHFAFELGFTNQTAEELLAEALNRKTFEQIGEEEPLYAEFPNEKQREYISKLVKGGIICHRLEILPSEPGGHRDHAGGHV